MNKKKIYVGIAIIICVLIALIFVIVKWFLSKKSEAVIAVVNNSYANEEKLQNLESNNTEREIMNITNTTNEIMQNQKKEEIQEKNLLNISNKLENSNAITNTTIKNKDTNSNKNTTVNSTNTNSKNDNSSQNSTNVQTKTITNNNSKEENLNNTTNKEESSKDDEKSKLANTRFTKYNEKKTEEAVAYINNKMQQDELYSILGGKAIAVRQKPTNYRVSYRGFSSLSGVCMAGPTVKVYIEDEYSYNSKGTDYYLYDTKAYIYQET